ncbi:MAG: imidazolonepropionase-like amidohydrolase [Patiriisocius sp.]|jgi:imidazolonepropionase-like amidohydrolase
MKVWTRVLFVIAAILVGQIKMYSQIPLVAEEQKKSTLIVGAIIHIGDGTKLIDGAVGFIDGEITFIGSDQQVKRNEYDIIIDAPGKHVYPSFIAPNSTLGIAEIGAVRATRDFRETGTFNPHVRSIVAYNSESRITPTVRSNGVLMGQITPRGGRISGQSSIVQFDAWDWEEAIVKEDDGFHLNWPRTQKWDRKTRKMDDNKDYQKEIDALDEFLKKAKGYATQAPQAEMNLRYEALKNIFLSNKTIYAHAWDTRQILDAIAFLEKRELKNIVLVGAYDAWRVSDIIADKKIPVMISRVHSLPDRKDEDIDLPFKMAKKLQDAGILFCLENEGGMSEMNSRNIPFLAGTCVAYGLSEEEAIASISLNAAKILGIDDRYGSLTVGKSATLFISTGDALDMISNNVERAFIDGRDIDLNNPQKMLYEKFSKRVTQ